MKSIKHIIFCCVAMSLLSGSALAQDKSEELAKKLANPVASLISVPIQANYDEDIGPNEDGSVWKINIHPVLQQSGTKKG